MRKSSKARLFSTCLTGAILAAAAPAWAQTGDAPTWKPRAEAEAQAGKDIGVSTSLFAPIAQNESSLVYVDGRIGYDQRFDRNGSATLGARFRAGEDSAIGVNVGADFYRSDIGSRDQAALSMGLEGFTSVFDVRVNYRLPLSKVQTIGYIDPAAAGSAALVLESNRLVERHSGFRLEAIPLQGFNGEAGVRLPVGDNASIRGSVGGFDYRDSKADQNYRGVRGGLELDIEDRDSGTRFTFGGTVEHDNRFGTDARAHVRLSIPFGGRAGDRGAAPTGIDRQMGDRVRRDYVARSGSRYTDLTTNRFAVDARTGNPFGGFYYTSGAGVTGAAGTLASPTSIADAVTRAGTNGVVVALGNAGSIATSGVTLATDQYLVGGASAVDVRLINGNTVQYALGGTNGVIVGTGAAGAAVTLGQGSVVRDVTVRGAGVGIAATGVGGFALDRVTIENTGGAGLSLTNTLGAVALTGLTIRGGAGAGVLINGGSSVSLANSTISGGASAIDINDGGANLTTSLSNLTLSATGGNVLDIDGSGAGTVTVTNLSGITIRGGTGETGGLSVRSASFDASTTTAGIQVVYAGRMEVGTSAARVNGQGVFLTDITGSLSFADLDIANAGATGLRVVNSKANGFTLATLDGTIDTIGGAAADLDPLVINLNFAGMSSVGAAGHGVILQTVEGGGAGGNALTIGTLTISNSGGGLLVLNSTGLVRVNGGTITNSGGNWVQIGERGVVGSGGSVNLVFAGSITDTTGASPIVAIFNTGGTINFTGPITGSGSIVVEDTLAGSAITFGAITLTGTIGDAITLNNIAGSINFAGLVTIANPGANGIVIGNVPGGVTFGDVDITGLGNFNGLDVRNTQGTVLLNTLDITGTGTGTGINVTGSTNSGNVIVLNGSIIQGVHIGVDLTQADMTGQFRFGDGNSVPMNSTIAADNPIVIALMSASRGSYNFADVNLVGDTTNLTGAGFTAYYARVGATGAGTRSDPGSLAGADASSAQYIVLLNDSAGGQDVFDAASAGGSFDLAAGQSLVSFLNGDFVAVSGAGVPANLTVSGVGPAGITNVYAGSGAALLTTTTAGSATVNLSNNARIDGLVIRNAGNDVGVEGAGVSGVTIANSDIGGSAGAIAISDSGAAASVTLTHLDLSSTAGTALTLSGAGAGTLTVSASDVDIAATGGSAAASLVDLSSGGISFGAISTGNAASGALTIQGVSGGAVTIGSVAVGGTGASAGLTISGNNAAVSVGAVSVAGSAGDAVLVANNSGAVTIGAISASASGGDAVELSGNSGAVTLGALSASNAVGAGLNIQNALGNVTVGSASVSGGAVGVVINGVGVGSAVTIGSVAVSGSGTGVALADVDGTVTFTGAATIANPGATGIVIGAGSAGTISFGDADITGLGANTTGVDARTASGTVRFNTLDITGSSTTGTRGIDLTGASFATNFTTTESGGITGVGVGVDLTNAAITGSFRYGDGSNTDADGAASSINAVTPIVIAGINVGTGSYNFLDVALTGDTSTLTSSSTLYFVKAGATGAGTIADPGSLAGAEASAADTIILLNDPTGGQDILDAAGAGGSLDLAAGRTLLSFLNGDTLMLPGGAPANLLLFGVPQGQIGNPFAGSGAPVLTTTVAGAHALSLGGSNTIDGVSIQTPVGGGYGVLGIGLANVTIRNSTISGHMGAIYLGDGTAASSAALSNLQLASSGGTALELNGTGTGMLTLTALTGITVSGGNGETGGLSAADVTFDADLATAGAQTVVGTVSVGSAGARLDGVGVSITGDGSVEFTSLDVFNFNSYGVNLLGNTALTAVVRAGSIDTIDADALVAQNAALTLDFNNLTTSAGGGIFMDGNTAANAGAPILNVRAMNLSGGVALNGAGGDYVFANASITDDVSVALLFGGGVNIDYAGDITSGPGASATLGTLGHTGTVSFHDGTIDATGGAGLQFHNADGTYNLAGTIILHGGDAGIHVASGSSGSFFFGAGTSVTNGAVANFMLQNSGANVTYLGSLSQGLNTDNFVVIGQTGGMLDFSQATISASAGTGLVFIDADGDSMLGDVQLSGGAGISITSGSAGAISFDNVDITGLGANQTAVDLTGATGNVTFQTLDIAGMSTTGSKGIDLTGSTTAATIIISESSSITGVGVGVDLTSAAITGSFRFGDGSSVDADGAASTISAGVPIEITGLNGGVGTYDFADVNLVGDTSRLVTSATTYFVAAGATGAGTMADPGNLAGAEASGAQIIVLLNNPAGGQDVLDAVDAGGTFDLFAGQSLLGFLNGDTLTLPAGGPTNLILFGLTPGQIVNPFAGSGAPTLTNSGAGETLNLRSNTLVDGVFISAPNGAGITAFQAANVTIRNSIVNASQGAILLSDGAANASAALSNLRLSSGSGAVLDLDGNGAGTLTITALDDINVAGGNGEIFGIRASRVTFDADLATAGFQTVTGTLQAGTLAARIGGSGIALENSDGSAAFVVDIASDGGTGLYVTGGIGGLRFGTASGTIDAINGAGLYLSDLSSFVSLDAISVTGGTGVTTNNVTGIGAGGNALTVSALTVADGAAGGITMTGGASGAFTFGQGSNIGTTTGSAITLSNSGSGAFVYNGDVNFAGANALLSVTGGHTGTVTFALGTLTATSGTGLVFDNADGTYNFSSTANLAAGIKIGNGSSGGFTFSNMAITNPAASALEIQDSTASLAYSGTIAYSAAATPAIYIGNHSGGTIAFGAGSLTTSGANGLTFFNADGTYTFANTIDVTANLSGIAVSGDSSGSFDFGSATSIVSTGSAINVSNSTASVDYRGHIEATGGTGVSIINHSGGTIDLSGATMDLAGGALLRFDDADATYDFGSFAATGGARITFLNGSAGAFTFGDVDITGLGANQTAVNLTGATGNVTFQTLDIAGTSTVGSKGIDLTGSTTAANIIVTESSSITGVGVGVDLTNAAITGTFRYGDGSSTDADGAASSISAVTPIAIAGLNPGVGTYNFADVVLTGDTSGLQTSSTIFWVQAGATGAGTRSDPGSLAAAEASGVDVIILLDTQAGAGQDVIDAASAGGSLDLAVNQSLLSFRNGDTLSVGGGAPANLVLFGIAGGSVTNPYAGSGAALLTTSQVGGNTVNLASGVLIDGVQIGNPNGTGVLGLAITGATIRNSAIQGQADAIAIGDNGAAADIALSNLDLTMGSGYGLWLWGASGGQLTVTELADIRIARGAVGSGVGVYGFEVNFDADPGTAGIQTVTGSIDIGSSASRIARDGLRLVDATGALSLDTTIFNANGIGLGASGGVAGFTLTITGGAIDTGLVTTIGSALSLSNLDADIQLSRIAYSGPDSGVQASNVTGVGAGGRALDVTELTVGAGANSGIWLIGTTSGNFSFGSASSIVGTTVGAVRLANTGAGSLSYLGNITVTAGALVSASNGDIGTATFSGTLGATGGTGLQFSNADGTYNFTGTATLNGGDAGIDIANGSAGTFTFGAGTSITSPSGTGINVADSTASITYSGSLTYATAGQAAINVTNHAGGTATFQTGTLNITNGTGLQFNNADGTYTFAGATTLNGGDAGIDIGVGSAGTFTFGAGTSITSPSGIGINIANSTAGLTYSGALTYATAGQAAVNVVNHSGGTILFQTGTRNITNGTGLQFDNADGTYNFTGATTLNGGDAGLDIVNGSGGTFSFGAGTSITSPSGIGIYVASSTASMTYSGDITYASNGAAPYAVDIAQHSGGTITFDTGTINVTNGDGLTFINSTGTYAFNGTTTLNGGNAGISVTLGAPTLTFGAGTSISSPNARIYLADTGASLTYSGTLTHATGAGPSLYVFNHNSGTIDFTAASLAIASGTGLEIDNADGTYQFGSFATSGGAGIIIRNGSSGTFSFGDVDITGLAANQTGVNLTGAAGNVTFNTLDITGTSTTGTRGIDLTGNTGTGNIVVTNSSTISGVGVGVDLTNSSRTALFQYGDGESAIDVASTITATTPLVITGLNGAIGTYNFADVNLVGDTSGLATSATVYYVLAGATGAGTLGDPGSLAGAELATADFIILLNDPTGGQDVLDALGTNGNDSLVLDINQALRSFRDSNIILLPGGAPANVILTGVTTGQVTNPFAASAPTPPDRAPILATSGAANTVTLANNSLVDGVFVQSASGFAAILGSGVSGVTLANSVLFGAGGGLNLVDGGGAASATLTNLTISVTSASAALNLSGVGAGSLTVTGAGVNVSQAGAGGLLSINDVAIGAGGLSFGAVSATASGGGVDLVAVGGAGTLSFNTITVAGATGAGVLLSNASTAVNLGNVTVSGATGAGIELANSGAVTIGTVNISTSATGIAVTGLTNTLTVGNGTIDGATVAGILFGAGNTGTISFGDINVTGLQTAGRGIDARDLGAGDVTFATLDITGASVTGTRGIDLTGNTGTGDYVVTNGSTIIGVGIGVDLTNASRTGLFQYGDGESTLDRDSTINTTTPIVIAGMNGIAGDYNFLDVNLIGDKSGLQADAFFVSAGAAGTGTRLDPGSLAAADASTAAFIVLLDNQAGAGSFDTITGVLALADGQTLLSFRDVNEFTVASGAPGNVQLYDVQTGKIVNVLAGSGAPLLTSTDATGTVQLGGTALIDGAVISNTGTGAGIYANGNAGTATIRNSTVSGGGAGINLLSGAAALNVNLQNLSLANAGSQAGALLNLDGTGGTLTLTGMSNLNIGTAGGETAGLVFNTVTFDSDLATGGIQAVNAGALTLGTTGARVQGDGLSLTNVSGALTFSDIDIANNGGTGLLVANSKANGFLLTTLDGSVDTTGGTAVNMDPLVANMTLASVTATGGAYGILLDQLEGSFTVTGAVNVTGATSAGIAIQDNTAQATPLVASFNGAVSINNTSGAGLSFTNNAGATISFAGGGTGVDVVTTSGAGLVASVGGTISIVGAGNSIATTTGQIVNLDGVTSGAGGIVFASLGNSGTVTLTAIRLNNLDGGAFSGGTVGIGSTSGATSDGIWIGGGSSAAISFGTTTIAGTGDEGIEINGAGNGAINFSSVAIDNTASHGILITGSNGTVTVSGGDIGNLNDPTGSGVVIDGGSGAITINAGILKTTAARAIDIQNRTGGSIDFGGFISSGGAASGWSIMSNSGGSITFSGAGNAINGGATIGVELLNNAGATINFTGGGMAITSSNSGIFAQGGGTLNITGSGNTISGTGNQVIVLDGVTVGAGGINFATVSAPTTIATGIALTNVGSAGGGAITLGTVNLQGVLSRGIDVTGTLGAALTIADLDIGLANTAAIALDLNGATLSAGVSANDFDVTNSVAAGTSVAVDLRGTTGGQVIRLGDTAVGGATSTISGVATGVWLNAATNATFIYGDGESATDGTSTISAATGINAAAAPVAGTYNFTDVTFGASPGLGFGVGRTWFVDSDGATGGGNGSGADGANPMTLAAAELVLGVTDVIVLVNNGGAISAAGSNGNDTLALLGDTQVRGFGQGALALTLVVPATIQLSGNTINIADPTGNGAATLTSAATANVITLGASGNRISGFILDGDPAGALRGIVDNGGATGTIINFMTIRNFDAVGGYGIEITPSSNTTIDNVTFTGNTNDALLNAAGSTLTNVTATGATGTSITIDNATGTTTLTNVNISGAATGLSFTNAGGTINATNVDIAGAATSALTVSGGTAGFNFDGASSIVQATGGLTLNFTGNHTTGTFAFAGLINATGGNGMQFDNADGTYNFTGITTLNGGNAGIDILSGATGTFAFGSATNITHNGAGNALSLLSSANLTFDGTITDNNGIAVEIDAHDAGTATFNGAISSSIGNAGTVVSITNSNGGAINFTGQMNIASTATVVNLSANDGSTITFNAGGTGLDIASTTGTGLLITGGGTVNVLGSGNSIVTTSGTLLSITNTGATTTTANLTFASASNTGGANGIFVQRTAGALAGTVNIGGGAITTSTRGISLAGDALDLSYGGTITATGGRSVEATGRTAGTVTLSGAIEDAFNGINIASNSGGTITLSGSINAAGAGATGGLTVNSNTGGTINFSGATKRFNTGATNAVSLTSNGGTTINFTGGGLALTTSSGAGFNATGGGTIAVTGAGNTIQTATGQIANLNGVSGGTGGINFASLAASGTVANTAINFNNFDGSTFTVTGTTNIAGTSGGGSDGIFIGNNSAAAISFGATTIAATGDDGVEVNGAGNGAVTFASVTIDSTNGQGVEINGSDGTVAINGGSIGATNDTTGNGVLVTGGNGTVTVAAAITKTSVGAVTSVTGRTGGTVTFSGDITASGAIDNGISVASNTGGTINFTGQSISLTTGANIGVNLATNAGATINFAPAGGGNGLDIVTTSGTGFSATGGGTVTVAGAGNTIQTATGQILNLTGVSAGPGGVLFNGLSSTGVVVGIAINLNNLDSVGGGAFSGGTTSVAGTSGGDAIFIGNGSAANIAFGATTIGTTAGTVGGDGIEVNGSGNGTVTFATVDIDGTTAHGINVTGAAGATGAVTISGGTIGATAGSIAGDGVNVTGGSGNVTVAATIAKTNAGNVVEVSSHSGGTVTFSNNLSATGSTANGILLSNNSGGAIVFSGATKTISTGANNAIQFDNNAATGAAVSFTGGGLDVDTTSGRGITAISTNAGAGSLTIQGTNNTIVSAGGIALNLVNTNIGGGGLNFLSISANGGTRGIVLDTTGGAGGLTITGTGTTDGSGGTIQNITQRGIELLDTALVSIANLNLTNASTSGQAAGQDLDLTTANGAIYMSGVATAVFNNINITGTIADNAITGINVSNFQLNNSLITGAGDGAHESGIEFVNLSGTSSLTNTEIALSETNSLDIVNTDVNLNLTLNNVIFRDTQSSGIGEGGLQFRSFSLAGGAPTTNIDIVDSDFLRLRTQGIQIIGEDDSVVSVDITNSVIDSQTGIGAGIDINGNDTATVRFNIIGNPTIRSSGGAAINITSFLNANVMGRISNNADIEVYSQLVSGTGASGSSIRLLAQENSQMVVSATGNTLTQGAFNNSAAVDVIAREGSARLDFTFTGNVIDSTDVNTLADINVQSGSSSGTATETNQIYLNIANNNLTATAAPNLLRLRVSELDNTHNPRIFLQGFVEAGAGIEDDAVATWNANGNTPGGTAANIAVSLTGTATGPSAGTALTPTNPLP